MAALHDIQQKSCKFKRSNGDQSPIIEVYYTTGSPLKDFQKYLQQIHDIPISMQILYRKGKNFVINIVCYFPLILECPR